MNDLINQVSQQAGITPDQAQTAINAVLDYASAKLPTPFGDQLKNLLQGGNLNAVEGAIGQVASGQGGGLLGEAENLLGGLFGGNKNQGQ